MSLTPRSTIEDDFVNGIRCAICGNPGLQVSHLEKYPDFVTCNQCGAAFIVENEGSWVMYGKIPAEYPETSQFALRQWTWLDAVAQKAEDEREMGTAPLLETQVSGQESEEVSEISIENVQQFDEITPSTKETETPKPSQAQVEIHEPVQPEVTPRTPSAEEAEILKPSQAHVEIHELVQPEATPRTPSAGEGIGTRPEVDQESLTEEELEETLPHEFPSGEDELVPPSFESIDILSVEDEEEPDMMEDDLLSEIGFFDETAVADLGSEKPETRMKSLKEEVLLQEPIVTIQEPSEPATEDETAESRPSSVPIGEPEPDRRFRVTIRGSQHKFPQNLCAHCLRTPVKLKAIMRGSLPDPNQPGKRKLVRLDLPFCQDCQKRMNAQSEEERNTKLLTFLISGLVAVVAIIATFALDLINLSENLLPGLIILLTVAVLGFTVPLLIGLTFAGRYPPPRDAAFVLSTLIVNEAGEDLTEFEWRNSGYAELFRQVNQENAIGEVKPIQDRVTFTEIPSKKMQEKKEKQPKSKPPRKPIGEDVPESGTQSES